MIKQLGENFPTGAPLVTNRAVQTVELTNPKNGEVFGVRFWPRGGKSKKAGNVTVYLGAANVDINGREAARGILRQQIEAWSSD